MTLDQLRMLKAVAELGTLKQASEALYKTQPAISQGLRQLEQSLGLSLFHRQGYRLAITADGQRILQLAQSVLKESQQLQQVAQHLAQGNEAKVVLAFEASLDLQPLLPVLEQVQQAAPDTQIILRQEYMSGAFEALADQQADVALSPIERRLMEDPLFELFPLQHGELVNCAAPRLLSRHSQLEHVAQLRDEYQIVIQDSGLSTQGKEFGVQDVQRRWYVNDFATKKTLIMGGMGWGKLPRRLIEDELASGELRLLELDGAYQRVRLDYFAIRRSDKAAGPVAALLWQLLANLSR